MCLYNDAFTVLMLWWSGASALYYYLRFGFDLDHHPEFSSSRHLSLNPLLSNSDDITIPSAPMYSQFAKASRRGTAPFFDWAKFPHRAVDWI
jgi:hypothetical protein